MSVHTNLYNAARKGEGDKVKELLESGGDPNLLLIGAVDGKYDSGKVLNIFMKNEESDIFDKMAHTALLKGACACFSFNHSGGVTYSEKGNSFFTKVSMLKGPGDAQSGNFKGLNL